MQAEKSKHKKRFNGNLRLQMLDEDEIGAGSSMKESSDYSCASSLTDDDDFYISKAPSVVARLMGLDSLPISNFLEPNSTPLSDCQSCTSSHYKSKNLECFQDFTEPKVVQRPIKKFQTKILPPKSVPTTRRHKLLSAARITEPGEKTNLPLASSSSSVPLKVRDSKEKVRAVKKPSKSDSSAVKNLKGHSMNKSWNGSVDSENEGKSISLALQAKANVRKRALVGQEETNELSTNKVLTTSQSQKSTLKKPCTQKCTNVLRQNNQKQNCAVDRKTPLPLKSGGKKALNGNFSSARQRISSKLVVPSRVSSSKPASEVRDDDKRQLWERVARKKRSFDHNLLMIKGKNGKVVDSSGVTDVVSFTFTAPMTRQGARSVGPGENCKMFSADSPSNNSARGGIQPCSLIQFQDNILGRYSTNTFLPFDLSDSASSIIAKSRETTLLTSPYCNNKPRSWELDYVNELVSNYMEPMFKDYALGKTSTIIKPPDHLFNHKLESRKGHSNSCENITRRLMFDCVKECLDLRCREYVKGGYKLWVKGVFVVKRKDRLAEDVYKVISGWGAMGHFMVDEIIDYDMSAKNGTWLDDYDVEAFELGMQIESRLLNSLIDEVVHHIFVLNLRT